jgi:hypothetical protein
MVAILLVPDLRLDFFDRLALLEALQMIDGLNFEGLVKFDDC